MFGFIRKSDIKDHIDRAVTGVSNTLEKIHEAEKKKLHAQYEDKIDFLIAEKESEIDEYCRQNSILRDMIARMERDKEDVKQGAIENTRLANSIDKVAKNILDTTDKVRVDMVQSLSNEFKKYIETLGVYWQTTAEIVNDSRAQQRKVIK
jgi:molecular chaperone GrpE (heat shock protein)